jgi:hypothetical protein
MILILTIMFNLNSIKPLDFSTRLQRLLRIKEIQQRTNNNNKNITTRKGSSWTPVAHAFNCSYSGDRDQKDGSSRPVRQNSIPYFKNIQTHKKKAGRVVKGSSGKMPV